ncbi:MAG: hypothetical protein WBP45_12225 [Daejeonella sp.]
MIAFAGWNRFKFVLLPEEFENLFTDLEYYFVITNQTVNKDYEVNDQSSVFKKYKDFFAKITSGQSWDAKQDWKLRVQGSIIDDKNKISFRDVKDEQGKLYPEYKHATPKEPVINISMFSLTFDNQLSVQYYNEEGHIGLELTYPKLKSLDSEGCRLLSDSPDYPAKNLYDELIRRIKETSNKAQMQSPSKLYKPNFWISATCKREINNNYYLKSNGLKLI